MRCRYASIYCIFSYFFLSKNMSAPTTMCLLVAAWPTVSVAHSATPSVLCGPHVKADARSNFVVAVPVRNCIEFIGKTSSRVEASCPECSGCLVVKQGTSVVWKTGNDVSEEFAASTLKENVNSCRKILVHYLDPSTHANGKVILQCRTCRC